MRAVAYTRVSTEEQTEGYSLAAQTEAIAKFCDLRGYTLVGTYSDPGRSGRTTQRPDFQRMIADAKSGAFDVIIVHKLDRFSRALKDVILSMAELEKSSVGLVSATEAFDYSTPLGRLMMTMLAALGQWYVENLATEVRKGKAQRARSGSWNGRLSWGYTTPGALKRKLTKLGEHFKTGGMSIDEYSQACEAIELVLEQHDDKSDTDAIPDPAAADGVVMAFSWYATGRYSDQEVADMLNETGYRISSRIENNIFGKETVADLLQNKFYVGLTSYGAGIAGSSKRRKSADVSYMQGNHEPLISKSLFDKCQEVRAFRGRSNSRDRSRVAKNQFPLTGLLTCADCGGNWSGWTNTGARYYRRTKKHTCETAATSRLADSIENEIGAFLAGVKLPEDWRTKVIEQIVAAEIDTHAYIDERTNLDNRFARLKQLYMLGDIVESEFLSARAEIQARIAALQASQNIPAIGEYEETAKLISDIGRLWKRVGLEDRKVLAQHLFRRIYLVEGAVKAVEPTPVMWVLLKVVTYSQRGEKVSNLSGVSILPPNAPREAVYNEIA